ncbi:peptide ABC transporter ATP-binding protein [Brevibacillus choshinensis]|uniref:Peptide ABC transporter ATP-binding protein n=1 Tax=Brevibacillus choshinensis TaxID=54911 RepID=A0ABR5NE52_BRECH|nr:ABC transporter ATP-binding protein [Brevibacillus choshinensis]KQL49816.1 peptide ABC transporter ATP-binding protein [Brevibacillus choshinensis]
MSNLLDVTQLRVSFHTKYGIVQAIRDVSFHVGRKEVVAIVGESGCGKSATAQSILGLLPKLNATTSGYILMEGKDLLSLSEKQMKEIRGSKIGMIFQDPMTSLNPTMTVGEQVAEAFVVHLGVSAKKAFQKAIELLQIVGIPSPEARAKQYPHQFSGGMRQRVLIAMALALQPDLLIADEPTTALDVTVQSQILDLLKDLQNKRDMSILLITHDLGVVANVAQRVIVMYAGEIVESGTVEGIFTRPQHPYTWGLLESLPRMDAKKGGTLKSIIGTPADLLNPPIGCTFAPRCPYTMEICESTKPSEYSLSTDHKTSCWLQDDRAPKVSWTYERTATEQ